MQGFGMNSANLTQVLMPGSDVVVAGGGVRADCNHTLLYV